MAETQLLLNFLIILVALLLLMFLGVHVALACILVSIVGAIIFWGYDPGLTMIVHNLRAPLTKFYLLPIIMFTLLGNVMFTSGMAMKMFDAMDKWLGRLPGRLALLAIGFSTIFSAMSGSQIATTAMLGAMLTPEMEARGYDKALSIGTIIGAGGLDAIIPPSGMAVVLGAISGISIGKLLISGIIPGLLLAFCYVLYIILRCYLQPSIAPAYDVKRLPLSKKISDTVRYVFPLGIIIFLVLGSMFLGWATPSESAAIGAVSALLLTAFYRKLNWDLIKKSMMATVQNSGNILLIVAGSMIFSQVLAFSGSTRYLAEMAIGLTVSPILLIIIMQLFLLGLGMVMGGVPMVMITMPIFIPIVLALKFDPVWFGLLTLINMSLAEITPPVGMGLFVMKGVSPDTNMNDIYNATWPFVGINIVVMALIIIFPIIATWLPSLMN